MGIQCDIHLGESMNQNQITIHSAGQSTSRLQETTKIHIVKKGKVRSKTKKQRTPGFRLNA